MEHNNKELAQMNEQELRVDIQELVAHNQDLQLELESKAYELREFKQNPIKAMLIDLLANDLDVGRAVKRNVEFEVDNQCMGLKDEILEDLDYKIDEQFDGNAFKSAVDEYMRRKF